MRYARWYCDRFNATDTEVQLTKKSQFCDWQLTTTCRRKAIVAAFNAATD
jgi:hypothetical protein